MQSTIKHIPESVYSTLAERIRENAMDDGGILLYECCEEEIDTGEEVFTFTGYCDVLYTSFREEWGESCQVTGFGSYDLSCEFLDEDGNQIETDFCDRKLEQHITN